MKCVEDIKSSSTCALASVRHLHSLCKSYSKTSYYKGADKATLGELNKQHEIVKLLTKSLTKVRVSSRQSCPLSYRTLIF